jgi:hypothetical protein
MAEPELTPREATMSNRLPCFGGPLDGAWVELRSPEQQGYEIIVPDGDLDHYATLRYRRETASVWQWKSTLQYPFLVLVGEPRPDVPLVRDTYRRAEQDGSTVWHSP